MKKTELVERVAEQVGCTKKEATAMVEASTSAIVDALRGGETVYLSGVGNFSVKERKARKGRNPQTGETIDIPATKVVGFKASSALKDAVNK